MSVEEVDNRIAIVGMAARVPGAADTDEFWANLAAGVESLTLLTDAQLRSEDVSEELIADPAYVRLVPLVDGMADFDARFFGLSSREADVLDPQHRMFLEVCGTALQHAGYDVARYPGVIGVFGGSGPNQYANQNVYFNRRVRAAFGDIAIEVSNQVDYLATRVAHTLGLNGPAVSVQTACSTSLVAVHLAAQALADGECTMAVAGGVNISLPYHQGTKWTENSIYSADGHVRAFDAEANGTNFGHGAGAVVLKRYADAIADGDVVHALILGSAVNNDGARRMGFTAPGADGQIAVISRALEVAGVAPDSIGYVEAHGTGTRVGDPIEVRALSAAYRRAGSTRVASVPIGSVKTNIGHLGPAAGVAGLIKTVLAMHHREIPALLHYTTPARGIDWDDTPFHPNSAPLPWEEGPHPRRAGISSFGIGGTNAHVIVEEPPRVASRPPAEPAWQVLPLSARTPAALAAVRDRLDDHLRSHSGLDLADVAYTLQAGRAELEHRMFLVGRDTHEVLTAPAGEPVTARPTGVAFLFPGQGTQAVGMAEELYRTEPVFRQVFEECAELLRPHLGADLRDIMFGAGDAERLRQTAVAQPALFAVEYALAALWASWGVTPRATAGHSVGELVAACLAGVFSLPAALVVVAARGALMQSMPPGAMLSVALAEDEVRPMLGPGLDLAAVNDKRQCVVSGPADAIAAFQKRVEGGVVLDTSHAFHSSMMDPILAAFRDVVAAAEPKPPATLYVSTLTGTWITPEQATDPGYWADHLRGTVRFAAAAATLAERGDVLLEVGPGRVLSTLARKAGVTTVSSLGRPGDSRPDGYHLATAAGSLWAAGVPLDLTALRSGTDRRRVALPAYPYERKRHWVDADADVAYISAASVLEAEEPPTLPAAESTFVPQWRPASGAPVATGELSGNWLVFTTGSGPAEEAAAALPNVTRVYAGRRFADLGEGRFRIDPSSAEDYAALLAALPAPPDRVLHGWTATPATDSPLDPAVVDDLRETGFFSLLLLVQALTAAAPDHEVDLRVLSTYAVDVSGTEPVEPGKALVTGPCKVIPFELRTVRAQQIDVLPTNDPQALLAELRREPVEQVVALRGHRRWVQEYAQVALPRAADVAARLRVGGTYLVTGGLGGVGLEVAKHLARTVGARLVLVGRTPLPPREQWEQSSDRRVAGVRELHALGAEVLVVAADVADFAALREAVGLAHDRFGRIDGVFHAAGVAGGGLAQLRTVEKAAEVLAPKVDGTLNLHRLLGDEIDLLVLFSSIIAVTGDYGMVDYASANAFMDAVAQARPGTLAVNWCGWSEVGMVSDQRENAPRWFRDLEQGIRSTPARHPLLGRRLHGLDASVVFSQVLDPTSHWLLTEHRIGDRAVLPGTAYAEMIRAAYAEAVADGPVELRDLVFAAPLAVEERREIRVSGTEVEPGLHEFKIVSRIDGTGDEWQPHARAWVSAPEEKGNPPLRDLAAIGKECDLLSWLPKTDDPEGAVTFGPRWQMFESIDQGNGQQLVSLRLPEEFAADCADYALHPAILDCATAISLYLPEVARGGRSYLPASYGRLVVRGALPARVFSHIRQRSRNALSADHYFFDIALLDSEGRELVTIDDFTVRVIDIEEVHAGVAQSGETEQATDPDADYLVSPAEGVDLLWRMLDGPAEHRYVVSRELPGERASRMARLGERVDDVDSATLAAVDSGIASSAEMIVTEPMNATQTVLAGLWQDMFGANRLSLDSDFFDLGGNSLVAVQLAVRMRQQFGVKIPAVIVLEHSTIRDLAAWIDEARAESGDAG